MKKRNLISFGAALILLFGDGFCVNRDEASSSNQIYSGDENISNEPSENSQTADTEQIIKCPHCGGTDSIKQGKKDEEQRYKCKECRKVFFLGRDYNYDVNQKCPHCGGTDSIKYGKIGGEQR